MKKLFTALLVGLSAMSVSTPAMAHKGDIASLGYSIWNFNFGARSTGSSYIGPGVVYTSANGANGSNNFWNYTGGVEGSMTYVFEGQSYEAVHPSGSSGSLTVSAPITHNASALNLSGYISSNATTPIEISTNVYGFGLTTGHAYVYTAQGQGLTAAVLEGISGVSTAQPTLNYTWYETSTGITYDVHEYFVWSSVSDSMTFNLTGGSINALQLTPLPPHPISHPVPEPATVTLLGIGGLAGSIMLKRKHSAEA
jgi:hypothetical protein